MARCKLHLRRLGWAARLLFDDQSCVAFYISAEAASFLSGSLVSGTVTFLAVSVAWTFFRAEDLPSAFNLLRGIGGLNGIAIHEGASTFWQGFAHAFPRTALVPEGAFQHLQVPWSRVALAARFFGAAVLRWATPNTQKIAQRVDAAGAALTPLSRFYRYAVPGVAGISCSDAIADAESVRLYLFSILMGAYLRTFVLAAAAAAVCLISANMVVDPYGILHAAVGQRHVSAELTYPQKLRVSSTPLR